MGRFFSEEYKANLKKQVSIMQIASTVTTVRKFGNNFLAICPFHNDTGTPNLQIDPVNNTFYCHSCGAGSRNHHKITSSDVISFAMHTRNIGFYQAVEQLSSEFGIALPASSPQEMQEAQLKAQHQEKMLSNQARYRQNLANNQEAIQYLINRGITRTEIDRWGLGFGDDIDPNFKTTSGRITFPVFDYFGSLISFTGRVKWTSEMMEIINNQREQEGKTPIAKYRDASGFDKSHNLYGIYEAKEFIRKWGVAIIVEGWTDVISLHGRGATNAVSTMGVALSDAQVEMIKRAGAKSAIIMRDGDSAGQDATLRDAKILLNHGIKPFVFPIMDGSDPDEFARSFRELDSSLTRDIYERKMTYHQWLVLRNWKDNEDNIFRHLSLAHEMNINRREIVIKNLLDIKDPVERNSLIDTVATLLLITTEEVHAMMKKYEPQQTFGAFGGNANNEYTNFDTQVNNHQPAFSYS